MDALNILILMARAAHGDEEAADELNRQASKSIVDVVRSIEKLTEMSIEPGSFVLGMAFEAHSLDGFADPKLIKHLKDNIEIVRDVYTSAEADES